MMRRAILEYVAGENRNGRRPEGVEIALNVAKRLMLTIEQPLIQLYKMVQAGLIERNELVGGFNDDNWHTVTSQGYERLRQLISQLDSSPRNAR